MEEETFTIKYYFPWRLSDEAMRLLTSLDEWYAEPMARALNDAYEAGLKRIPAAGTPHPQESK